MSLGSSYSERKITQSLDDPNTNTHSKERKRFQSCFKAAVSHIIPNLNSKRTELLAHHVAFVT